MFYYLDIEQQLKRIMSSLFRNKEALTFLINTDGASICKSSKLTLWPVYLVINELDSRFSLENVILAGEK
jgi:hypothetical protein